MIKLKDLVFENSLKSLSDVKLLFPELLSVVQDRYDSWDQSDEENGDLELGFGGICQDFADVMSGVLTKHGIESRTIDNNGIGDQHVWVIFKVKEGVFELDIPPSVYERGGGYNWKKIPNIKFTNNMVHIDKLNIPWEDLENYD